PPLGGAGDAPRPQVVVDGEPTARDLRVVGDRLYWVERAEEGVYLSRARPHGGPAIVAAKLPEQPIDLLVAEDDHVYWTAASGRLYRQDLIGGEPLAIVDDLASAPLALASADKQLYWTAADACVRRLALGETSVHEVSCARGTPVVIAVQGDSVYWGNAEGDLFRASTGGSEPKHLAAGESFDSRLLADQAEVFWVNAQLRSVRAADRRGLHGVRVVARHQYAPVGLAMDRFGLYFSTQSDGSVKRVAKTGGEAKVLAADQAGPADVARHLDRVYWINELDGTISAVAIR